MSDDNKLKGVVEAVSVERSSLFLLDKEGNKVWWAGIGKAKEYIKKELKGCEVEITIINLEKKHFSFIKVVELSKLKSSEEMPKNSHRDQDLRSFAVSYSKDLVNGGKVELNQMIDTADMIFNYIRG